MDSRQNFITGQTVTVLTDDGFVFVGQIIDCEFPFTCTCCETTTVSTVTSLAGLVNTTVEPLRFLVLQLQEDVEGEGAGDVFNEGQQVFINFEQIIAIAPGFPPSKK